MSLLTFLLLAALFCLGVSHWNNSRQLSTILPELRQLRDEQGQLSIEDESKFHAVALDSEPNTWRWRLFIPKGVRYKWNIACEDIPQNSPPTRPGVSTVSNEPYWENDNEVLVTARLREGENGNWTLSVTSKIGDSDNQMGNTALKIPAEKIEWMTNVGSTDGRIIGSRGTVARDPLAPIFATAASMRKTVRRRLPTIRKDNAWLHDLVKQTIMVNSRDNNTLHTEPRAVRLFKTMIFAAAR